MFAFSRLLPSALIAVTINAATQLVPPASQGVPDSSQGIFNSNASVTDTNTIVVTVSNINQKDTAAGDSLPNQPVPETTVTAVDGATTDANTTVSRVVGTSVASRTMNLKARLASDYWQVFAGTGTGEQARDASIQGTAYLTYTLVSNATYDVNACLAKCDQVEECGQSYFQTLDDYSLLDFLFGEKSNLKCALYADIHTAAEKTNFGGQQSEDPPAGLTYIQNSSGYAKKTLVDPSPPEGYEITYGPTGGANNAAGYMGFALISSYDVNACAALCNTRGPDPNGGTCAYFNIWRAVVNGNPTTYTCSFYYQVTDESTAVNYGQGDLKVTYARGYARKNLIIDSGFEDYTCSNGGAFCFAGSSSAWVGTSPVNGTLDASVFHHTPYAHSGSSVALLGSASGTDALAGTLAPAMPLATIAGKSYLITFFHASVYSGLALEAAAFVEIVWNDSVISTIKPGYSPWKYYEFTVQAQGNDKLAFHGGKAPAWSFIDDVKVYEV